MGGNSEEFLAVAEKVRNLKTKPSNDDLLVLYSLYKQATVGDVNIECPGVTDVKGKAKFGAWEGRKGMSKEDAEKKYVEIANGLIKQDGTN